MDLPIAYRGRVRGELALFRDMGAPYLADLVFHDLGLRRRIWTELTASAISRAIDDSYSDSALRTYGPRASRLPVGRAVAYGICAIEESLSFEDTEYVWQGLYAPDGKWITLLAGFSTQPTPEKTGRVRGPQKKVGAPPLESRPDTRERVRRFWALNDGTRTRKEVARELGFDVRTVSRWVKRFPLDSQGQHIEADK